VAPSHLIDVLLDWSLSKRRNTRRLISKMLRLRGDRATKGRKLKVYIYLGGAINVWKSRRGSIPRRNKV